MTPNIGMTSTPVIDPKAGAHGTIYMVAASKDSSGNYHQRLHALDLTTGAEQSGSPVSIQATFPSMGPESSNGQVVFDPKQYNERAGLLLLNGVVYLGWSSHCDDEPYTGWLMGYNENSLAQTSVLNLTPNGSEGSIWQVRCRTGGGLLRQHLFPRCQRKFWHHVERQRNAGERRLRQRVHEGFYQRQQADACGLLHHVEYGGGVECRRRSGLWRSHVAAR